jgi:glucokinase
MKKIIIGIDIGGTNVKMGLFSASKVELIEKKEYKTPRFQQQVSVINSLKENIDKIVQTNGFDIEDLIGIGVAVPCAVKNGFILSCPNIGLDKIKMEDELKKFFPNASIKVANDATMAAFGENKSLDKPFKNVVFITLGTGVGGGIIIDGNILEGSNGFGGEIGHIKVHNEDLEPCGCGANGCIEQICGTKGILTYTKKLATEMDTIIDINNLNIKVIFDAAKAGDKLGNLVVERVAKYIGMGAAIIGTIIDPEAFIIGGGISKSGDFLLDKIVANYKKEARFTMAGTPFLIAKTGNDAGILGSAYYINMLRQN